MGRELSQPSACRSKRHGAKEAEMKKLALLVPLALALAVSACSSGGSESSAGSTGGGGAAKGSVEAHAAADAFGGFVVESFASQGSGKRIAEGSLVLRIPAESYDSALSRLRQLGKVESLEESGQDVSKECVDLNARIRQLRAVEAQLLELLERADDVPAALAVQNQLSQVQLDLEQARGRLQYLDNRVAFATISMSMHELGVVAPQDDGFGIVDAWATAGSAFLTVVGWLFVGIAVAAPVLILLGLGFLVGREVRRRLAHA